MSVSRVKAEGMARPPSVIREPCRGSFEDRIVVLEEIADDAKASASDRIRALDLLGKYGLGTSSSNTLGTLPTLRRRCM